MDTTVKASPSMPVVLQKMGLARFLTYPRSVTHKVTA